MSNFVFGVADARAMFSKSQNSAMLVSVGGTGHGLRMKWEPRQYSPSVNSSLDQGRRPRGSL